MIEKAMGIEISRETVRQVCDYVGNLVYEKDKERAENTYKNIANIGENSNISDKRKPNTIYVMMDGAEINTRVQNENGHITKIISPEGVASDLPLNVWKNSAKLE